MVTTITMKVQSYGDTAYGWAMEDIDGFVKIVAERATGNILGAHIMGQEATNDSTAGDCHVLWHHCP